MKFIILFALICAAFAAPSKDCACSYDHGDGRPGCKTDGEMTRLWRNNWDSTAYWKCVTKGQPATSVRCSSGAFSDADQKCVGWDCWVWTPPCDPPSKP